MNRHWIVTFAAVAVVAFGAFADELPGAAAIAPGHPNLPNGYELVAHFVCGAGSENKVESNGNVVALTKGAQRAVADAENSVPGEAFDPERIEFSVTGLDPASEYALGFTWWDRDRSGRRQSVELALNEATARSVIVPPTVPLAFHGDEPTFARIQLPVNATSRLSIAFVKDSGPDAVVSELWLLRKTDAQKRKRVVIVTGDDWTGHYWRGTGPELAGILREDPRLEVWIVESPAIFASPFIDGFDAAVIHFKDYSERLPLGSEVWNGLDRYVAGGHGLVVAHFGCGSFQEWPGYVRVVGRIWDPKKRGHDPYGPFRVRIADPAHPITKAMNEFETSDELYTCLAGEPKIHVLYAATSCVDRQEYPMGFVVTEIPGRVFHSSLGHDVPSLRHPGARELYRRAAAWAAGLEPTAP
ncbi:MAG: ThuA domain-containing protein [Candidatus Hydrogenedentes bacterium]|nr:ThuA domain-containing protein [Candidatus Hydrogenedentota bacterium]